MLPDLRRRPAGRQEPGSPRRHNGTGGRAVLACGYPLHIDATCEKGKGGHFLCMDGRRVWVLQAERIVSENGDLLRPVV